MVKIKKSRIVSTIRKVILVFKKSKLTLEEVRVSILCLYKGFY